MRTFCVYLRISTLSLLGILALGISTKGAVAQPVESTSISSATAFNALFTTLDLNAETQNNFAITANEYEQLQAAWQQLSPLTQSQLTDTGGWKDFALMLLYDLHFGTSWEDHVRKAAGYGAENLSLTVSRHKNVITVKQARKTMVDVLRDAPVMMTNETLNLPEQLKNETRQRAGKKALQRLSQWEALINNNRHASALDKLSIVFSFFDRHIRETADKNETMGFDYWQSPIESLVRGKGDCDDFAIAHYVSLRLLGIPANQLRIAVVDHPTVGPHGVMLYYPKDEQDPWVLDNLPSIRFGAGLGDVQRLSFRKKADGIALRFAFNEHHAAEFKNGKEEVLSTHPKTIIPAFATALTNANSLLSTEQIQITIAAAYKKASL